MDLFKTDCSLGEHGRDYVTNIAGGLVEQMEDWYQKQSLQVSQHKMKIYHLGIGTVVQGSFEMGQVMNFENCFFTIGLVKMIDTQISTMGPTHGLSWLKVVQEEAPLEDIAAVQILASKFSLSLPLASSE
jgi:hypothetical protein